MKKTHGRLLLTVICLGLIYAPFTAADELTVDEIREMQDQEMKSGSTGLKMKTAPHPTPISICCF